ncbi:MAG TPA: GntR family transcriptional regulator [Nocardioidaceae bacterium]|nr:GntR family transcriptional regulator [Nocardioidaceae bacterium]
MVADNDLSVALDSTASSPPYDQIRTRVVTLVKSKRLTAGDRMPTVRQLATDLGVAANTVARAYRELEQAGVIETRGRAGTFVAGDGVEREAKAAAAAYVAHVRALGLNPLDALSLVERLLIPPATGQRAVFKEA